jgi:hypothetical protein
MSNPDVAFIARDPNWLAHRYDPQHDAIHFLKLDRAGHRAATFVTDEYIPATAPKVVLRRDESVAEARKDAGPLHFIFHSGFCGSTLLARALDIEGVSMGLKEPVIFNDIVGWRRRGGEVRSVAQVLDDSLALLARPFSPGEAVIVKPSNILNAFAPAIMGMRPDTRAIFMYAPLKIFLGSVARKRLEGRLWVRKTFAGLAKDGVVNLGFDSDQYFGQTDLQIAAAGWLAQQDLFAKLIERFGHDRVQTLNSEAFVAAPRQALTSLNTLFALGMNPDQLADVTDGPAFSTHSKTGGTFGASDRAIDQTDGANIHREEIDQVAIWAEAVAIAAGIRLSLESTLLA